MGVITKQPTANQTPDAGQGGSAVTSATNTGHASTLSAALAGGNTTTRTCRWSGFENVGGSRSSVKLIFDWNQNGDVSNGSSNQFRVQYSINGGSNWNSVFDHQQFQGSSSNNGEEVILSNSQDLSQVQIRDLMSVTSTAEEAASMTATVSNIKIEVVIRSGGVIVCD